MSQDAVGMVKSQIMARGIRDKKVCDAMRSVPRELFVSQALRSRAYDDCALPTQAGQTISQPYIVALMTFLLDPVPGLTVLDVGTGSGYQAALLAYLGMNVVTIERIEALSRDARRVIQALGLSSRVTFLTGDGTLGCPSHGPYDRIMVAAGAPSVPTSYVEQAVEGARLVIPVGGRDEQALAAYVMRDGNWVNPTNNVMPGVRFVPLVGRQGW